LQGLGARGACVRLREAGNCLLNKTFFKIHQQEKHQGPANTTRAGEVTDTSAWSKPCPCHTGIGDPFPTLRGSHSPRDMLRSHHAASLLPGGSFNSHFPPLASLVPREPPTLTALPRQPSCQETCLNHLLLMQGLNQLLRGCFTRQSNNNVSLLQLGKLRHTKRRPRVHWN